MTILSTSLMELAHAKANYEKHLNEQADIANKRFEETAKTFIDLDIESCGVGWSVMCDDDSYPIDLSLAWDKTSQKFLFVFDNDEAEVVLGLKREQRIDLASRLPDLVNKAIKAYEQKTKCDTVH